MFSVVIPTLGRPSLGRLLASLDACDGPWPDEIVLVDDRLRPVTPVLPASVMPERASGWTAGMIRVIATGGRGPAAARNAGWRALGSPWIAFLDDDVEVTPDWLRDLHDDLSTAAVDVGGSQGRLDVPLPADRRPTDWERGTHGLTTARWITADLAYRRAALAAVDGFDERFRRAFREDADLALRVTAAGYRIVPGRRRTVHPVRPAAWHASVGQQRGNADDALMRALHGARWHERAGAAVGRRPQHLLSTAAGVLGLTAAGLHRRAPARLAGVVWAALTADFARRRIAPGPRTRREITAMALTSVLIPPAASWHWLHGLVRYRQARPWSVRPRPIQAVLLDRDGTMVRDVPYNGVPELVEPLPGVEEALGRLRAAGLRLGVVTNQSGIARGSLTMDQVRAVNARVDALLGPFGDWQICPHGDGDGCSCRKPRPGMVRAAAEALGVPVERCALIGDTGADVAAAVSAGAALAALVPNDVTRPEEIAAAPAVFATFADAVDAILSMAAA
jgi:histidinol-phosphate phosphatase family protein